MNTLNKIILSLFASSFFFMSCNASIKNSKTETVKIYGNCGMCEEKIETAIFVKKEAAGDWNESTQMATITFDSVKTSMDVILKRVAVVGYDSDKFLAPNEVYNNLHGCCQYERPKKENSTTADANIIFSKANISIKVDSISKNETPDEQIVDINLMKDVFANYFDLKDALTKDLSTTASNEAKSVLKAISLVDMSKMNPDQKSVWEKILANMKSNTQNIANATNIETQRTYFASLSKSIYELTKVFEMEEPIYYMYCPMFNDGKGAVWLSEESGIKNPYYGTQMLSCGSLNETIK